MGTQDPIDVDMLTESGLSSLSDLTPTNPFAEPLELGDLIGAVHAANDSAYELAYQRLPATARVTINGIKYARFEPLRGPKAKKRAWYWDEGQAEELLRFTKGMSL